MVLTNPSVAPVAAGLEARQRQRRAALPCRLGDRPRRCSWLEAVADAPHRLDVARLRRIGLDLGAQAADVDGDRRGVGVERVLPDASISWLRENTWPGWRARNSSTSNSRWVSCDLLAVERTRCRAAGSIFRSPISIGASCAGDVVDAPQHRVDPRDELGRRERLDDVVVGAEPQADHAVGLLALRGQQDHRDPIAVLLAQPAHHLEPVEPGKHQVEHDEIGRAARRRRRSPRRRRPRPVSGSPPARGSARRPRRSSARRRRRARSPSSDRPLRDCRSRDAAREDRARRVHELFRSRAPVDCPLHDRRAGTR